MNLVKASGIPLYYYTYDELQGEQKGDICPILVMEELKQIEKDDVFPMLTQLIPVLFKWRNFMSHCDIKPDNILKSFDSKHFYFIDYDSICKERFIYGYKRDAFTPQFASQSNTVKPAVITFKQDLIELITSATYIYHKKEIDKEHLLILEDNKRLGQNVSLGINNIWGNKFSEKRVFGSLYLTALNIDDIEVFNVDTNNGQDMKYLKYKENEIIKKTEFLLLYQLNTIYYILHNMNKVMNIDSKEYKEFIKNKNNINIIIDLMLNKYKGNVEISDLIQKYI